MLQDSEVAFKLFQREYHHQLVMSAIVMDTRLRSGEMSIVYLLS